MSPRKRWLVLLSLLAAAAGLLVFSDPPKSVGADVVGATGRNPRPSAAPVKTAEAAAEHSSSGDTMILAIRPRVHDKELVDAFAPQNWTPPPPPPPPAPPPPKPSAPPLPFTVLGKKLDEAGWQVFLARQDRTYIVHVDDVIDGTYRVDSIKPPNITLLYIPLSERQSMAIGESQ